jgi:CDP-glucose 4,6-dehydratase
MLETEYRGDVRNEEHLREILIRHKPEIIFHLAAQSLVRRGYREPLLTFDVNIMGVAALLEAVRNSGQPCIVIVATSDKCYENSANLRPHTEDDPMGGDEPYSASKGAAELVVAAYRRAFWGEETARGDGVLLASVRAGNVVGGGDWAPDRILPDAARALAAGQPVPVRNPGSIRPWQHVLECLSGYLWLACKMISERKFSLASAWNFGPAADGVASVREVVEVFCEAWGGGRWIHAAEATPMREAQTLSLSIEKAVRELGWSPRWRWRTAVKRAANWYCTYYHAPHEDMRALCLGEINAYVFGDGV